MIDVEFWTWYENFKDAHKDFNPSDLGLAKLKQAWTSYRYNQGASLEQMEQLMYYFISQFGTIPDD